MTRVQSLGVAPPGFLSPDVSVWLVVVDGVYLTTSPFGFGSVSRVLFDRRIGEYFHLFIHSFFQLSIDPIKSSRRTVSLEGEDGRDFDRLLTQRSHSPDIGKMFFFIIIIREKTRVEGNTYHNLLRNRSATLPDTHDQESNH